MASPPTVSKSSMICDVWAENIDHEFARIRELVQQYPYVAMDTEFPGVVAKPVGTFRTTHEFYYQTLRCNVNLLKMIQVGISLMNERGEVPDKCCTWQFNLRFSLQDDIYAQDSIDLLKSSGINFDNFAMHGIDLNYFVELLTVSGLVLNDSVHWLSFHSGYDFGYLIKALTGKELPEREDEFEVLFHTIFPSAFDIKYVLRQADLQHSVGLDTLADVLGVKRIGAAHQAGSDSLLTGHTFFKLVRDRMQGNIPQVANGILYGLGEDTLSSTAVGGSTPNTPINALPMTGPNGTPFSNQSGSSTHFPSTPAMALVMHGGSKDSKVHQNAPSAFSSK